MDEKSAGFVTSKKNHDEDPSNCYRLPEPYKISMPGLYLAPPPLSQSYPCLVNCRQYTYGKPKFHTTGDDLLQG